MILMTFEICLYTIWPASYPWMLILLTPIITHQDALEGSKITRCDWSLLLPKNVPDCLLSLQTMCPKVQPDEVVNPYVRDNYGVDVVMVTGGSTTEPKFWESCFFWTVLGILLNIPSLTKCTFTALCLWPQMGQDYGKGSLKIRMTLPVTRIRMMVWVTLME